KVVVWVHPSGKGKEGALGEYFFWTRSIWHWGEGPAGGGPAGGGPAGGGPADPAQQSGKWDSSVERTRSITGLIAVVVGDVVIALAAIIGTVYAARGSGSSSGTPQLVAILSSAFTAIGTLTTAYFGIRSVSNTATNLAASSTSSSGGGTT